MVASEEDCSKRRRGDKIAIRYSVLLVAVKETPLHGKELVGARIFKRQSVHCIQDSKRAANTERTSRAERRSLENSLFINPA